MAFRSLDLTDFRKSYPFAVDLSHTPRLLETSLRSCVFPAYQYGPVGISAKDQDLIVNEFKKLRDLAHHQLARVMYVEGVHFESQKPLTDCALVLVDTVDRVYLMQAVYQFDDEQITIPPMPPSFR